MKRSFDFVFALMGLVVLAVPFLILAVWIKLDSPGPVFFRQERIGKDFKPFRIFKFRTMVKDAERRGGLITAADDPRITKLGRILRSTKIDELPQLINVLTGEMSLVGPRPEVRPYIELYRRDYEEILKVKPGITDLASLKYSNESEVLGNIGNSEEIYAKQVLTDKLALAKEYLKRESFFFDLTVIFKTLRKLIFLR